MFRVISKNIECEIDKNQLLKENTSISVYYFNLYFELWTKYLAFLSVFIAYLECPFISLVE